MTQTKSRAQDIFEMACAGEYLSLMSAEDLLDGMRYACKMDNSRACIAIAKALNSIGELPDEYKIFFAYR